MNQSITHLAGGHSTATSVPKKSTNRIANSLPNLPMKTLFAITFGFCGVNMAFSLQSSQMSRIFQTIGADPTKLGLFFILPPLAGLIVQPLVGKYSDMTWTRFGRRMPYLLFAAPIAAIVMILYQTLGHLASVMHRWLHYYLVQLQFR